MLFAFLLLLFNVGATRHNNIIFKKLRLSSPFLSSVNKNIFPRFTKKETKKSALLSQGAFEIYSFL